MKITIKDGQVKIYNYLVHTQDVHYIRNDRFVEFYFKGIRLPIEISELTINDEQATKENLEELLKDLFLNGDGNISPEILEDIANLKNNLSLVTETSDKNTSDIEQIKLVNTTQTNQIESVESSLLKKADLIDGKVPTYQLPAAVDEVIEGILLSLTEFEVYDPETGMSGIITEGGSGILYIDIDDNKTYRWSGSIFAHLDAGLVIGETASTAGRGDYTKEAYEHSKDKTNPHNITTEKIGAVALKGDQEIIGELTVSKIIKKNGKNNMLMVEDGSSINVNNIQRFLRVQDARNIVGGVDNDLPPNYVVDRGYMQMLFSNKTPVSSLWQSILHVHAWTDTYGSWQLIGGCDEHRHKQQEWYLRASKNLTEWHAPLKIIHSGNIDTSSLAVNSESPKRLKISSGMTGVHWIKIATIKYPNTTTDYWDDAWTLELRSCETTQTMNADLKIFIRRAITQGSTINLQIFNKGTSDIRDIILTTNDYGDFDLYLKSIDPNQNYSDRFMIRVLEQGGAMIGKLELTDIPIKTVSYGDYNYSFKAIPVGKKYDFDEVRYIRDWSNGNSQNNGNHWVQVVAYDINNINVALNKFVTNKNGSKNTTDLQKVTNGLVNATDYFGSDNLDYITIDLGSVYKLSSVGVIRHYLGSRFYKNTKTEVSTDGINWRVLRDSELSGEYKEPAISKLNEIPQLYLGKFLPDTNNYVSNLPENWEQGSLAQGPSQGDLNSKGRTREQCLYPSTARLRYKTLLDVEGDFTIYCENKNYLAYFGYFDANGLYLARYTPDWANTQISEFPTAKIFLMVSRKDNGTITPQEIKLAKIKVSKGSSITPFCFHKKI